MDMAELLEIKKIIEAQGTAWEEFKKTNDAIIKGKAEGKAVADLEEKLAKISADLEKNSELKADLDALAARVNRPQLSDDKTDTVGECKSFNIARRAAAQSGVQVAELGESEYVAYKAAFEKLVRYGEKRLGADEVKALQAGVDSDGGYLLPTPTVGRIVARIYELSPIRAIASVQAISTDALEGINDLDEASCGWVAETATRPDTGTPQVGKYRVEAHEMYAQPKATQKLLDDAAVDVEAWLATKVADRMARVEGSAFINGNGVGKPVGFTTYTTAATGDATRAWGQMEHVVSGANGAFAASNPADVLFDLIGAFKNFYLQRGRWVTRREVITAVRKFKEATTNAYMWQPGLQAGQPDRLLGYPITIAQDMPALATGSLSLALGDFVEGYTIVDRMGARTLRDPYTDKPYVKFYTTRRCGGAVLNFEAIKFIKFSAS